jgi:hypothetical protein
MSNSFRFMLILASWLIAFSTSGSTSNRILAAEETGAASAVLPKSVDLRPKREGWGLEQRRQGRRGTCSVFTVVEAVEYACAAANDKGSALSVEFANWAANEATGRTDDGDFFHNIIRGIETHGICTETSMPYSRRFNPKAQPESAAVREAGEFRQATRLEFHWIRPLGKTPGLTDDDVNEIKATLARGFPVGAGSYHSVLFVGYEDDPALEGGGKFLIADSNLRENEISYQAAKDRFSDMFWVRTVTDVPESERP